MWRFGAAADYTTGKQMKNASSLTLGLPAKPRTFPPN
jgi:hypothetical protein